MALYQTGSLVEAIDETRRLLLAGSMEERNKLAGDIVGLQNSATFIYDLGSIDKGAKISVDLEDMYVWGKSSQTATVERAQFGSVLQDHDAGSTVYVNPKFSNFDIFEAFNQELHALSSPANGLFGVQDYVLDYNPSITGYNFEIDVIDIFEVRYSVPGPSLDWPLSQDWEYTRHAGDDFVSDNALFVRDAYPNRPILVKAKIGFTRLLADNNTYFASSGLPESCWDILILGAAWRLASVREIRRNFDEVQGDTRRANEVPPGANLGGARELGRLRQLRINEEAARLNQQYPIHSPRYPFAVG